MTLGEAPGGPEFIGSLIEAIKNFSLLYAGTPNERARPHLESYLSSIEPTIVEAVGAGKAPIILDGMRRAVMTRKHEIEAGGGCIYVEVIVVSTLRAAPLRKAAN